MGWRVKAVNGFVIVLFENGFILFRGRDDEDVFAENPVPRPPLYVGNGTIVDAMKVVEMFKKYGGFDND